MFKYLSYFYFFNFLQMKKLYFLFFLTIGFLGNAQIINFPDANFKAKLLSASSGNQIASTETPDSDGNVNSYSVIDVNGDGEVQASEALNIKYLNVSRSNISDLSGINFFLNLEALHCEINQLSTVDFSQNSLLSFLNLNTNQLTSIDVSQNSLLSVLICSNNQLTILDVTQNLALRKLETIYNQLNTLNVTENPNLEFLNCRGNQLTSIDVSQNSLLSVLDCGQNLLTSINVSQNSLLTFLGLNTNQLTSIDVSETPLLSTLECGQNLLTSIDVTQNPLLNSLGFDVNQLTSIDVSQNLSLGFLSCSQNQLTSLDVSQNPDLLVLYCNNNQLTSLDLSQNPDLLELYCNNNVILKSIFLKNGGYELMPPYFEIYNNPQLEYICVDEEEYDDIHGYINYLGLQNQIQVNSYCSFTPGGTFYDISGVTKFDFNNNGCAVSDISVSNLNFSITDGTTSGSIISNESGNYSIPVQAGNYTITPILENPTYFNNSPLSFVANFPTQTSPFTQDFCVTANGVKSDVEIVLLPITPARPGFDANYKLVYRNKGNQIENGSISFTFDDARLDYVSANPVYSSSATNSFTWNYVNLQPFETREIILTFNVNSPMETPAVNNGDVLNYTTTITTANTDQTPADNTFTLDQTVVGSYDPNDKTCLEGTTIAPSEVGKHVHYVIRFENTGTFPAENIVVKDMIDLNKFDIATLVPLKSSHDFYTRINGNKVEFIFENINLDFNDATNDGYVVFKIKTKPTLVVGNTFTNNANIYFDYNFPITTNTYITTVAALSAQDYDFGTYFTLYPNPAKDVLNIQAKLGVVINSIEIYNQLGQIVMATTNDINSIDVTNLASGTYFVKVNTEKGSANAKFVKE